MSEMTSNAAAPHEAQAVSSMTMIQALRSGLDVMMAKDDNVIVYGEDVGYFGGVFRVTEGLQKKYGKTRCFDAPISEAGIVGTAIGMAAYGLRPAVEIQFADYVYPAYDQIVSELARLRHRSAGDFFAPITIRIATNIGMTSVTQLADVHSRAQTHMLQPLHCLDAVAVILVGFRLPHSVGFKYIVSHTAFVYDKRFDKDTNFFNFSPAGRYSL